MSFEPFEPHKPHEPVGAVFSKVTKPGSDVYGATTLINELLQHLQTRLRITETSNLPVGPLLDQLIDISEMEAEYLQDFEETKNSLILSDLDRRMLLVGAFSDYIKEWLENASDDSISNDTYYCIIYHVYNDPFMWSLFQEVLPPKILVADNSESLIASPKHRGPLLPINIVQARMGLALSGLGIRMEANGFLAIYHAVTHICVKANDLTEREFTELLESIPVNLVNETPLHQLGLKLITVIVYEFASIPRESTIFYKATLKAILDNSRWLHFKRHVSELD
jgi:hypothetical protein